MGYKGPFMENTGLVYHTLSHTEIASPDGSITCTRYLREPSTNQEGAAAEGGVRGGGDRTNRRAGCDSGGGGKEE